MFGSLQVLTVILVTVAMALALAHALELPGKMRLDKETYYAMQPIYYPGFTIGGISEPTSILLVTILLVLTPSGSADFWLTLVALLGLIGMQAVYWLFTHPVNKFWVEGENLDRFSSGFFSFGTSRSQPENETRPPDWTALRDRWEYSHVARLESVRIQFRKSPFFQSAKLFPHPLLLSCLENLLQLFHPFYEMRPAIQQ